MNQLPGVAAEIQDLIGLDRTVALLKWRGGCEVQIPVRPLGSALASVIGDDAAEVLTRHFGAGKLVLPCAHIRGAGARRAEAMAMLREGHSLSEVALACDMHTRSVSRLRAQIDAEDAARQPQLPFDRP